jgi:CspA family cold shock protein
MLTGTIGSFYGTSGYGFLKQEDGSDIFFHITHVLDGFQPVLKGQEVVYETIDTPKGIQATNVLRTNIEPMIEFDGQLTEWYPNRGFGFIRAAYTNKRIFVHVSDLTEIIPVGSEIIFEIGVDNRDRQKAINVKVREP